jgi:Protein of unknown function DUF262
MSYTAESISSILPNLNNSWYLPSLQREFVWGTDRICELFDSLMRAYPISSLLTWKIPDEARDEVEAYRFLNQGSDFGAHNIRERAFGAKDLIFVLDGQQRLTSLLIGLKGTYEVRRKYARTGESQRLHLDLLRDGEAPDDQGEVSYGFEFRPNSATASRGSEWFEVDDYGDSIPIAAALRPSFRRRAHYERSEGQQGDITLIVCKLESLVTPPGS